MSESIADIARDHGNGAAGGLQLLLSHAVDLAGELPPESVYKRYDALIGLYVTQIIGRVVRARAKDWNA